MSQFLCECWASYHNCNRTDHINVLRMDSVQTVYSNGKVPLHHHETMTLHLNCASSLHLSIIWKSDNYRSVHFLSNVINTVFVLNCIRLSLEELADDANYTLFPKMQQTQHCLHEILPKVKTSSFTYVTNATSMNNPDAVLKFTKDPSSHTVFLSSFWFFFCVCFRLLFFDSLSISFRYFLSVFAYFFLHHL